MALTQKAYLMHQLACSSLPLAPAHGLADAAVGPSCIRPYFSRPHCWRMQQSEQPAEHHKQDVGTQQAKVSRNLALLDWLMTCSDLENGSGARAVLEANLWPQSCDGLHKTPYS